LNYEEESFPFGNYFRQVLHKRKNFEHEKELRAVIWKDEGGNQGVNLSQGGQKIKLEINDLIENVYVSPESSKWVEELINDTILKFGFSFKVIKSTLNDSPIY
jgi:hypothetical protein